MKKMVKIKLTEQQLEMLAKLESENKKKILKLTTEQYNRLFENQSIGDFKNEPKQIRLSNKLSRDFKKYSKQIPDSNIKFESIKDGIDEIDVVDFGKHVIKFLKELITTPDADVDELLKNLGIDKDTLVNKMLEIGMLTRKDINGRKILAVNKANFFDNIKKLYDNLVSQVSENENLGDDFENSNKFDAEYFGSQLKGDREGEKPSQDDIKRKLKYLRDKELERRRISGEDPLLDEVDDNYPLGASNDSRAPWNEKEKTPGQKSKRHIFDLVYMIDGLAILKKGNKYYVLIVDNIEYEDLVPYASKEEEFMGYDEDGLPIIDYDENSVDITPESIENYVNDNYQHLNFGKGLEDFENGKDIVEIDGELRDELLKIGNVLDSENSKKRWNDILKNIPISETTTASSSGSYVGKLGGAPIHRGLSPKTVMNKLYNKNNK